MRIEHIDDLLPAVEGRREFVVVEKEGYTFIDYVYVTEDTFDDPRRLECRGIKFDRDGKVLARPFRKFFNYGERGTDLPMDWPHVVVDKLDGSMIHPAIVDGKFYLMTRKGHTDVARKAEEFMLRSPVAYEQFMRERMAQGYTPIFEYTAPDNRIVLRYDEPALTLLAERHNMSGDTQPPWKSLMWTAIKDIPYPHGVTDGIGEDLARFLDRTRALEDAEGYVVYFIKNGSVGHMVKIKAEDYVLKHRALDDMGSKKKVLALVLQGFADDVKPVLGDEDRAELEEFEAAVTKELAHKAEFVAICFRVAQAQKYDRKTFATKSVPAAVEYHGQWISGCLFGAWDGKDPATLVMKAMSKNPEIVETKWRGE